MGALEKIGEFLFPGWGIALMILGPTSLIYNTITGAIIDITNKYRKTTWPLLLIFILPVYTALMIFNFKNLIKFNFYDFFVLLFNPVIILLFIFPLVLSFYLKKQRNWPMFAAVFILTLIGIIIFASFAILLHSTPD